MSNKLNTTVSVKSVNIHLPASLSINEILIKDQKQDTLLHINSLQSKLLAYDKKLNKVSINELVLDGPKIKIIKYLGDTVFNYQFLVDNLKGEKKSKDSTNIFGYLNNFRVSNAQFIYHDENKNSLPSETINYNNLFLKKINGVFQDLQIKNDTIKCNIHQLSATEQCGFALNSLSGYFEICNTSTTINNLYIETPNSKITTDLTFRYENYNDYLDFVNKVTIEAKLERSKLEMSDIAHFSSELDGISKQLFITGDVRGRINNIKCKNIDLVFGKNFNLLGNITLSGLPIIEETFIQADIKKLTCTKSDLEEIPLPPFNENKKISLPDKSKLLGLISFKGNISGFYNDLVAYGQFKSALGVIKSDISLQKDGDKNGLKFNGHVISNEFNLGKYLGLEPQLGKISLNTKVTGNGLNTPDIMAHMNGTIQAIDFNGYSYKNATIIGDLAKNIFTGELSIKEENIGLDFSGVIDFSDKVPVYDFSATIDNANLVALGFDKKSSSNKLSAKIKMNLTGNEPDNLIGEVLVREINFLKEKDYYSVNQIQLSSKELNKIKTIDLKSDWIDAKMIGTFKIVNLPTTLTQVFTHYIPALGYDQKTKMSNDKFTVDILIKNGTQLCKLLIPSVNISNNTSISGNINASNNLFNLKVQCDSIELNKKMLYNLTINSDSEQEKLQIDLNISQVAFNDSMFVRNIKTSVVSKEKDNKVSWSLGWRNDTTQQIFGSINGIVHVFSKNKADIILEKSGFNLNDSTWTISNNSTISIDSNQISFNDFLLSSNNQKLEIAGNLKEINNELIVRLQNFNLENINPFFATSSKVRLKGHSDGTFTLKGVGKTPLYNCKLHFSKLFINNEKAGDGDITATWDPTENAVSLNGNFTLGIVPNLTFDGKYYPKQTSNSLALNISLSTIRLQLLEPWLKGYCSDLKGQISGQCQLSGTPEKPIIVGKAQLAVKKITVDYLNTSYSLATDDLSEIILEPNSIGFENITIYDQLGNSANARGKLFHNNFKDFQLDFDIETQRFLCLNTTAAINPDYYGKAFVSGNINFFGFMDNILISSNVKTLKGTEFNIPLEGPQEIGETNFITFVKKDERKNKLPNDYKVKVKGLSLDFKVDLTPDAEVQLIFDSKVGDVIKGRGNGNMELKINSAGRFSLVGDYNIESGDYLFTLKNIINKKFDLEKGGTIKWVGDPLNAEIDLKAVYRQKASLKPFFPYDSSDTYKRRYPVETRLLMTGNLLQPEINFDIDMPTLSDNVKQQVKSYINTDQELNRQVFSLLVLKSFVPPPQFNAEGGSGNAAAANSSELLSNQLSNWLSQISNDFDVGVNYRPGDEISNEELEVALSTQLFNDRMSIDGNVGVNNNAQRQNSSNLIGDVNIDYKITDDGKFRVKAFNRSNDNNFILNNGPYTQGVGMFYREEFGSVEELYKRYLKKIKGNKNNNKEDAQK